MRIRVLLTIVSGWSVAAYAHGPGDTGEEAPLESLIDRADYIFKGTVVEIGYRNARNNGLAHTFVTYAIESEYKGRQAESEITLRFVGGPDHADPARVRSLTVSSGVPSFDIGDRDILFVHGNGRLACPLVGAKDGRVRLIDGNAYSESGQRLIIDDEGEVRRGAQTDLQDVDTQTILGRTFIAKRAPNAPVQSVRAGENDHAPLSEDEFSILLSARTHLRSAPSDITRANPVTQARPWLDFEVTELRAVAPKRSGRR